MITEARAEERAMLVNLMIKHLRHEHGLTQRKLGELIGVSQREVWRYEKPGYKVSPETLIKISSVYNCSMDVLFGNTQHPAKFKAIEELKELKISDTWI